MIKATLKRGAERRVKGGHPWVFSNEIGDCGGDAQPGATVQVHAADGSYIGTGYYNPHSLIAIRILSRRKENIDDPEFYRARLLRALHHRHAVYPGWETFRAVYGEGDFLPGLVVDKYGDLLSIQFLTLGMDTRQDLVLPALIDIFNPKGILARNDTGVRSLEGLPEQVEVLYGHVPERVLIEEHGLRFTADLVSGQKTGHFLDQKENHLLLERISNGKDVLDCFCYSGGWGIHAAAFGAASVRFMDSSERALGLARENAGINGLAERTIFDAGDAFERLRSLKSEGQRFDIIILDPPAFVKRKKALKEATKGYLTINRRGMELLREGGYLVTCSCSYHMNRELFRETLENAARQAGREMRLVSTMSQAPDHPVLLSVPETEYLKCFLLQAV
ncbi:MAG TPA: class I SAM-dependent rRNA methyltransferase [Geobacteraceae bacterium]|nr:class I SAM-dependent rRNA methyltransferase [Geobacteraceae bacterium]